MSEGRILRGIGWGLCGLSLWCGMASPVFSQDQKPDSEVLAELAKEEQRLLAQESALIQKLSTPGQTASDTKAVTEAPVEEKKASVDLRKVKEGDVIVAREEKAKPVVTVEKKEAAKQEDPAAPKPAAMLASAAEEPAAEAEKAAPAPQNDNAGADLKKEVETLQRRASALARELDQTRNRLIIAETEVERLSSVLAERNRASLAKYSPNRPAQPVSTGRVNNSSAPAVSVPKPQQDKMTEDMLIATVVVDKAHLRTGPGKDNSPLMTVSKGTRLAIETRNGEWYRVISPTGARAWVSSDCLAFGQSATGSPTKTVKVRGYDSSVEDEASRFIREELR